MQSPWMTLATAPIASVPYPTFDLLLRLAHFLHRYVEEMIRFHYEPNSLRRNEILRAAVARHANECSSTRRQRAPEPSEQQQAETQTSLTTSHQVETQTSLPSGHQAETQTSLPTGHQAETQTSLPAGHQAETQTFLATGDEGTQTLGFAGAQTADASVQHRPVLSPLA